ncbi:hypothetical protein [Myceligenerans indicum]|uniref:SRPBCC family protein n=1 Tax=Myceligenerans indicum TaxID=2593663 RepID=A0ABS1LMD1_9MICO|nr:hypothetical protein [Myceligenerans indicum]MBL0887406.1 hypothetical protein [Myceligenerans indicum]
MSQGHDTLSFEHDATMDVPADEVDVTGWLFGMSDRDYQDTARGHQALGTSTDRDGRHMVNVESIGGNLLVQHYVLERGTRSEAVMHSPRSTIYLAHLIPARLGVRWTMAVRPATSDSSVLTCRVELDLPRWMNALGRVVGLRRSTQSHVDEEAAGYARDLARKVLSRS